MKSFHIYLPTILVILPFAARIVMADAGEWEKMKHIAPRAVRHYDKYS